MKKLLTIIGVLFVTSLPAQNLDTVFVSLTLRSQDWAWAIGQYGEGADSISRAKIRQVRAAMIAANPATWTTNVTINNVPGNIVLHIYRSFLNCPFGVVLAMGTTTSERTTIYTNIRALTHPVIVSYVAQTDLFPPEEYIRVRTRGKNIVLDN